MTTEPIEIICPECGQLVKVNDIRALLLALQQGAV